MVGVPECKARGRSCLWLALRQAQGLAIRAAVSLSEGSSQTKGLKLFLFTSRVLDCPGVVESGRLPCQLSLRDGVQVEERG